MAAPDVCLLAVWQDRSLIVSVGEENDPEPVFISGNAARTLIETARHDHNHAATPLFLGLQGNTPFFAVDLSTLAEHDAIALITDTGQASGEFIDLRSFGGLISQESGSILAFARGLAYWHRRHQFCGVCGTATKPGHGGHVRHCSNPECAIDHFPRTDPAVIMLVTAEMKGVPHCLLGRQASWTPGMYSSLAGFVEPGESLETAVAREVMEEASIEVTDVEYRASQPWPFPSSLMLGFRARATTFDIDVGTDELEEAQWFTAAEIQDLTNTDLKLSRGDSIARWLIEDWLSDVATP